MNDRALVNNRVVTRWRCPTCEREFGRSHQSHVCAPATTVAQALGRHPAWVGEIYREVIEHLRGLGPVHEDAVAVGVFCKSDRTVVEFRPKVRSAQLWLALPYAPEDRRVSRVIRTGGPRTYVVLGLTDAEQVDDQVREWLTLAYEFGTDQPSHNLW